MKKLIIAVLFAGLSTTVVGQKYLTQSGTIKFFSSTPLEDIEAVNNQVSSVINLENGEMAFTLLMKAFVFEKSLMQEHFNEKYVESDKYPKASFKGTIKDFNKTQISEELVEFLVKGTLTIHGISKEIVINAKLKKSGEKIIGASTFKVALADYKINVPSAVQDNIEKEIEVTVNMEYEKLD